MIVRQRDIILIPFPYSDFLEIKKRPALILSNNNYHRNNNDMICCAMTSASKLFFNSIVVSDKDLQEGNLIFKSSIRPNKLFTIRQNEIIRRFGRLDVNKFKDVLALLNLNIEIDN